MKKKILVLMLVFLLIAVNLYAADGDLIVEGKVGIGTTTPGSNLDIQGSNAFMQIRLKNTGLGGQIFTIGSSNNDHYLSGGIWYVYSRQSDSFPLIADGADRVGIGLGAWRTPSNTLTVDATKDVFIDRTGPTGYDNKPYLIVRDANTQFTISKQGGGNFGKFNVEASNIYFSGNLGIGTTIPTEKLEVAGAIRVADTTSSCDSAHEGTIKYVRPHFYGCDGSTWKQLD